MTPSRSLVPLSQSHAPGPAVPAILATPPNALSVLKALGRCWARAVTLALVCAAAGAVGTWYLMPSKATAPVARTMGRACGRSGTSGCSSSSANARSALAR